MAGSDLVVAAIMWSSIVTVWSSKKEMEQLYCLNIVNYPCMAVSCEHSEDYDKSEVEEIQVVGNKVVFLRFDWWQGKTSLIVIDKGEQNVWESKTLACINDMGSNPPLATDENCIAVAKLVDTSYGRIAMPSTTEVKLWQNDTFRQDICLLECSPLPFCTNIALKLPFLVVSSKGGCVKVYQLAADKGMEEVGAVASLMKCIQVAGAVKQLIFNTLFFGFVLGPNDNDDKRQFVVLIEKKVLLDEGIPGEETEKRGVLLHDDGSTYTVSMNTTSLVFALWLKTDEDDDGESVDIDDLEDWDLDQESDEEEVVIPFHKKDFWKTS